MQTTRRVLIVLSASILCAFVAIAQAQDQDAPSLGDAARHARQQKQQKDVHAGKDAQAQSGQAVPAKDSPTKDAVPKDAQSKNAQATNTTGKDAQPVKIAKKVITNDEIPEHVGPTRTLATPPPGTAYAPPAYDGSAGADHWKSQIEDQKNYIASLETEIKDLTDSIQYAGGNCVSNCLEWNQSQDQKRQQVEEMKSQLKQMQKQLEQTQEMLRRQGFGSSVYDP
ncbi:MAG TPA: hypothetical protein VFE61_05930 [Candidatus Sulfotelmatobacter sp.]|jgi:hypothetical protein|nr:hypothetical protein [Candidatus Sulfotelmatobacter sp.]